MILSITLKEIPSTGYRWHVMELPKNITWKDKWSDCLAPKLQRTIFFAIPPNAEGIIKLNHKRSWELESIDVIEINIDRTDEGG